MENPSFTLAIATCLGVLLIMLAGALRVPSIAFLLAGGVIFGPEVLGLVDPSTLGSGLETVVKLSVAVILFEGGLTLDLQGYRRAPQVIVRMLTAGVAITWLGAALTLWLLFDLTAAVAVLGGSLVIVTGPTVISPLLRRIGVQDRVHHVLYWEGVLVDAVGVFVAILCLEWATAGRGDAFSLGPVGSLALRLALGIGAGLVIGLLTDWALRRGWVDGHLTNIFVLSVALALFAASDAVMHEAGILAVIVAGFVLGVRKPPGLKHVKRFKLELTEAAIGLLFILLTARLDLSLFARLGWPLIVAVAIVALVLRPLNVAVSTAGRGFELREKVFLSWMGPRGIVAASMASLVSVQLARAEVPGGDVLVAFTFAVIGTTVVIQGMTAPWLASVLGLKKPSARTWLLVGDPELCIHLGGALHKAGAPIIVVTPEHEAGERLQAGGVPTVLGDPLNPDLLDDPQLHDVGFVLAASPNRHLNRLLCQHWRGTVPDGHVFRWADEHEHADVIAPVRPQYGAAIWHSLPSPAEMGSRLEAGTWALDLAKGRANDHFGPNFRPIFALGDGTLHLVPDALTAPAEDLRTIVLHKRIAALEALVVSAVVIPDAEPELEAVVRTILSEATEHIPDLPVEEILTGVVAREQSMPTALGLGVAIPHAYTDSVERPTCLLASVTAGLPIAGSDQSYQLVFLLLSPPKAAEEHLQSLAAIARLVSEPGVTGLLERETDPEKLLALVHERA